MEIAELLTMRHNLTAACEIERALPFAKTEVQVKFWDTLQDNVTNAFGECERDALPEHTLTVNRVEDMYLKGRCSRPYGLSVRCGKFEDDVELRFVLEIWETFFFGFIICKDGKRLNLRSHPMANEIFDDLMRVDPDYAESVRYDYQTLYKYSKPKLDWKTFDDDCVSLADPDVLSLTVQSIVLEMQKSIDEIERIGKTYNLTVSHR